eukprot:g7389.t1
MRSNKLETTTKICLIEMAKSLPILQPLARSVSSGCFGEDVFTQQENHFSCQPCKFSTVQTLPNQRAGNFVSVVRSLDEILGPYGVPPRLGTSINQGFSFSSVAVQHTTAPSRVFFPHDPLLALHELGLLRTPENTLSERHNNLRLRRLMDVALAAVKTQEVSQEALVAALDGLSLLQIRRDGSLLFRNAKSLFHKLCKAIERLWTGGPSPEEVRTWGPEAAVRAFRRGKGVCKARGTRELFKVWNAILRMNFMDETLLQLVEVQYLPIVHVLKELPQCDLFNLISRSRFYRAGNPKLLKNLCGQAISTLDTWKLEISAVQVLTSLSQLELHIAESRINKNTPNVYKKGRIIWPSEQPEDSIESNTPNPRKLVISHLLGWVEPRLSRISPNYLLALLASLARLARLFDMDKQAYASDQGQCVEQIWTLVAEVSNRLVDVLVQEVAEAERRDKPKLFTYSQWQNLLHHWDQLGFGRQGPQNQLGRSRDTLQRALAAAGSGAGCKVFAAHLDAGAAFHILRSLSKLTDFEALDIPASSDKPKFRLPRHVQRVIKSVVPKLIITQLKPGWDFAELWAALARLGWTCPDLEKALAGYTTKILSRSDTIVLERCLEALRTRGANGSEGWGGSTQDRKECRLQIEAELIWRGGQEGQEALRRRTRGGRAV